MTVYFLAERSVLTDDFVVPYVDGIVRIISTPSAVTPARSCVSEYFQSMRARRHDVVLLVAAGVVILESYILVIS